MSFSPTDISGLTAWFDASDDATVTGVNPVTQWNDKSGNDKHLTHATLGPAYSDANDRMEFRGSASSPASPDTLDLPSITARTVFFFLKMIDPQTPSSRYHALLGEVNNTSTLFLDVPDGSPSAWGIRPKGAGFHKGALNGSAWVSQEGTGGSGGTIPFAFTTAGDIIELEYNTGITNLTWVGATGLSRQFGPNADVSEIIIYDRVLTEGEKEEVEGYIAHKWSRTDLLPVDHPYKTVPPGTASVAPDDVAIAVTASSPSISAGGAIAVDDVAIGLTVGSPSVGAFALGLTDIVQHRIYQRDGTSAGIALAGTYSGTAPADIQARVMQGVDQVLGWVTLSSASIAGGDWSGTLAGVPQGGMYTVEVRSRDGGGAVLASVVGTNTWGVGDIFGVIGSSTPERWFTDGTGNSPDPLMREYDGGWLAASTTGNAAVAFANQAIADGGIPVALMDYGVGGSTLSQWYNDAYSGFTTFAAALAAVGGKIAGVIVHIGSNDARNEAITDQAQHESRYRTLIANLRTATGQAALPVFIMGCARAPNEPSSSNDYWGWARAAEHVVGQDSDVYLASTVVDLAMAGDNVHLSSAAMTTSAQRVARCVGAVLYGTGLEWRNPLVASVARVDDTHTDVVLTHFGGDDITPSTGITGFEISIDDFATTLAISAAVRQSASSIRLTHASTGGSTAKLRYQWGTEPDVSGAANDNGAAPRPLSPMPTALLAAAWVAVDDATIAVAAGSPAITGHSPVAANDVLIAVTASAPTLAGHSPVTVDGVTIAFAASEPDLLVGGAIAPASALIGLVASSPVLAAHSQVAVDGVAIGVSASSPSLMASSAIAVADVMIALAASAPLVLDGGTPPSAPIKRLELPARIRTLDLRAA